MNDVKVIVKNAFNDEENNLKKRVKGEELILSLKRFEKLYSQGFVEKLKEEKQTEKKKKTTKVK